MARGPKRAPIRVSSQLSLVLFEETEKDSLSSVLPASRFL